MSNIQGRYTESKHQAVQPTLGRASMYVRKMRPYEEAVPFTGIGPSFSKPHSVIITGATPLT